MKSPTRSKQKIEIPNIWFWNALVEALQSPKRPWTNIDFAFNYRKLGDYKQKAKAVLRQKYWRSISLSWLLFSCPWILFLRSFFAKLFAVINPDMPLIFESLELKWPQYWSFSFGLLFMTLPLSFCHCQQLSVLFFSTLIISLKLAMSKALVCKECLCTL